MSALTFSNADLKGLLVHAMAQWPKEVRTLYDEKTGEGFWLVGDQGVYLMHNGAPHERAEGDKTGQPVAYARECNPETLEFEEWWSAKNATFGADDGVEFIERATIEKVVHDGDDLRIGLNSGFMSISGVKARTEPDLAAVRADWHKWWNGVVAEANASPDGQQLAAAGFALAHTGGGCTAWERPVGETGWRIVITDSEGLGHKLDATAADDPTKPDYWLVGAQDEDGSGKECVKAATVAEALAAAATMEGQDF